MRKEKVQRGLSCVLVDAENFARHFYDLTEGQALENIRALFWCIDNYLKEYELLAPIGCRKVFVAKNPPKCVQMVFQSFRYEVEISKYRGKNAADLALIDYARLQLLHADPRYVKAMVIASSDKIFATLGEELKLSPIAGVCIGREQVARVLTKPFDEAIRFTCDSFGERFKRLSAPIAEIA